MQIRQAEKRDIPQMIPMVRAFHKETLEPFGMGYDTLSVEKTLTAFVDYHVGLVVEVDGDLPGSTHIVGLIGGAIVPSFTDLRIKIFYESMWYVLPEHRGGSNGIKLLKLVEDYCVKVGVNKIVMIGMYNDNREKLAGFYSRMGFKELEIHYIKDLPNAI